MTTYRQEGKDMIIFATAEDHQEPSKVVLPESDPQPGLILPNGEINWNCPCLGGMATGPCGVEFREAFTCFHKSEADPKGSDCYNVFKEMHLCMAEYPALYNRYDDRDDDDLELEEEIGQPIGESDKKGAAAGVDAPAKEPISTTTKLGESPRETGKSIEEKAGA